MKKFLFCLCALCYAAAPVHAKPTKLLRSISLNAQRRTGAEGLAAAYGKELSPAAKALAPQLTHALEQAAKDAAHTEASKITLGEELVKWGRQLVQEDKQLTRPYRSVRPETAVLPLEGNAAPNVSISPLNYYALWATNLRPHAGSRYAGLFQYGAPDLAGLSAEQLAQYAYLRRTILQHLKFFYASRANGHTTPFQYMQNARKVEKSVIQMARFMGRRPDVFAAALYALKQDVFPRSSFARDMQLAADGQ